MSLLRRVEVLGTFFSGMALGVLCTLHNKIIEAQEKPQDEARVVELVYTSFNGGWEVWRYPRFTPPLSREGQYYIREHFTRLAGLQEEFERDYLFEQRGAAGKPKQEQCKIWCFRQALHAAVRAYPGCPPSEDRFPELFPELQELVNITGRLAYGGFEYYVDGVIYAPTGVDDFAKSDDRIYVIGVRSNLKERQNLFWVNARTGEVAALFPPPPNNNPFRPMLVPGTRVLLERPKK